MADVAIPAGRLGAVSDLEGPVLGGPGWGARLFRAAGKAYAAEGERRLLWLPVLFGAGIGVYFSLDFEPPLWLGVTGAILALGLAFALPSAAAGVRGGAGAGPVLRRLCSDRRDRLGAPGADFAAPPRAGGVDRAGGRHRLARPRLAGHRRARSAARARSRRAAAPRCACTSQRRATCSTPATGSPCEAHALSGAGPDPAGRPRYAARGLISPGSAGSATAMARRTALPAPKIRPAAAGASGCGVCAPRCRGGSSPCCRARPAGSPRR